MRLKARDFGVWGFLYRGFVIAFCVGMVMYSRYTFNLDDIWYWLDIYNLNTTTDSGYKPTSGRFYPFAFWDIKLLAKISTSPYLFFSINAAIVFAIALMLLSILRQALDSAKTFIAPPPIKSNASSNDTSSKYNALIFVSLIVCFLNPGFVTVMLGICYPERPEALFLCIFLLSSLAYIRTKHIKFAIIGIISANACIYLKETAFLLISGFSFFYLLIYVLQAQANDAKHKDNGIFKALLAKIKDCDRGILIYHSLICLSGVVFLLIYVVLVVPQMKGMYDKGFESMAFVQRAEIIAKGFGNYVLNDSFVFLLLPILILVRILQVAFYKKHNNANDDKSNRWSVLHPFWDASLVAGVLCAVGYIKLMMFGKYYLLPVYFMSIGGIIYTIKITIEYGEHIKKCILSNLIKWLLRLAIVLCVILYLVSSIPQGIYTFASIKSTGVIFYDTLEFMRDYVEDKP
ncbi:hypothetical protein BKN38_08500 [Helicobacter sp. CLO-3]|nr:hypothetical protein BKN38_08500 [Helicobacter sp. CLO-3]